jgi:lipoprotein-anchoring transpeptidase ErfK/SrfK
VRAFLVGGLVAAFAAAGVVVGVRHFAADSHAAGRASTSGGLALVLPDPVKPAFTVPTPKPLETPAAEALWAPVARTVVARAAPRADGRPIARLELQTPEGTSNLVSVVAATVRDGSRWLRVRLPVLPNNTTGWVPRSALGGLVPVDTRLVVDLERLRADLFQHGRRVFEAPVGVGTTQAPTPRGYFYIRDKLTSFGSSFYGPVAFGTSARSAVLTDWPDGGYIGIHGTNEPQLIPGRVSHGCIRMRNEDITRLAHLMPVGTPLLVR